MTTITFDTLKFVNRLTSAGVPEAYARAEAEALVDVLGAQELATKLDIAAVKADLIALEQRLDYKLEAKINDAKAEIIKWMAGLMIAQAGLVAALVKMLL